MPRTKLESEASGQNKNFESNEKPESKSLYIYTYLAIQPFFFQLSGVCDLGKGLFNYEIYFFLKICNAYILFEKKKVFPLCVSVKNPY